MSVQFTARELDKFFNMKDIEVPDIIPGDHPELRRIWTEGQNPQQRKSAQRELNKWAKDMSELIIALMKLNINDLIV